VSDSVVIADSISKAYLLGRREQADTFFGNVAAFARSPFRNFRELYRLNTYHLKDKEADSDDILWALRDVSFEVKEGECLGIVGRNGAGKSTLLKILSRIADPTRGQAEIKGRVSALLEVGTGFHPELTGRENVYLNGTILGMSKVEIDNKFDEITEFSGVERFLDTPVKRYSSGMKVRLAFSVAAHLEPEILIVDEVLAVGDSEFQKKCIGKMNEVSSGEGRTVLFVSHNMVAVRRLCDRVMCLESGREVATGPTDVTVTDYLNRDAVTRAEATNLLDLPRTNHDYTPTISGLTITGPEGGAVVPGSPVYFDIDYYSEVELPHSIMNLEIGTREVDGLLCLTTRWNHGFEIFPAGEHRLTCSVEELPLAPGDYTVNLQMLCNWRPHDGVDDAAQLTVGYSSHYGAGDSVDRRLGHFLVHNTWELPR
jgi:lipopolysaccharide transport system ATP-binding protein